MKWMSKEQLVNECSAVFQTYPDIEYVFAVTDGNIFHPNAEIHAKNHASFTGHDVIVITREEWLSATAHIAVNKEEAGEIATSKKSKPKKMS